MKLQLIVVETGERWKRALFRMVLDPKTHNEYGTIFNTTNTNEQQQQQQQYDDSNNIITTITTIQQQQQDDDNNVENHIININKDQQQQQQQQDNTSSATSINTTNSDGIKCYCNECITIITKQQQQYNNNNNNNKMTDLHQRQPLINKHKHKHYNKYKHSGSDAIESSVVYGDGDGDDNGGASNIIRCSNNSTADNNSNGAVGVLNDNHLSYYHSSCSCSDDDDDDDDDDHKQQYNYKKGNMRINTKNNWLTSTAKTLFMSINEKANLTTTTTTGAGAGAVTPTTRSKNNKYNNNKITTTILNNNNKTSTIIIDNKTNKQQQYSNDNGNYLTTINDNNGGSEHHDDDADDDLNDNDNNNVDDDDENRIIKITMPSPIRSTTSSSNNNNNNNNNLITSSSSITSSSRRSTRSNKYPKEKCKTAIAALIMIINFILTTISLALVHERVPDRTQYGPLPDIVLDSIDAQDWALAVSEVIIMILFNSTMLILILHKYRFIVFRRLFLILSLLYLMRSITMYVTVLPISSKTYYCSPKLTSNTTTITSSSDSSKSIIIFERVIQLISGFGLSINGKHTYCGDYIYSGHTVILVISYLFISEYTPKRFYLLHWLTFLLAMIGVVMVLIAHGHYTVDVIIAYYVTTRLFWLYHTLCNNSIFKNYSTNNYIGKEWWFPLFKYFECNVGGVVPRQYNWPLPWPKQCVRKHPQRTS